MEKRTLISQSTFGQLLEAASALFTVASHNGLDVRTTEEFSRSTADVDGFTLVLEDRDGVAHKYDVRITPRKED